MQQLKTKTLNLLEPLLYLGLMRCGRRLAEPPDCNRVSPNIIISTSSEHLDQNTNMDGWESIREIEQNPNKVSGASVFKDTHAPVSTLFENLRDGATVKEFLKWFPNVTRTQVNAVLNSEIEKLSISL